MGFSDGISMPIDLERRMFMTDQQEREAEQEIKRQVTELFDVSNRLELIDVISNAMCAEYGTEPNAMIRILSEFGTAMRDLDASGITRAYQRINEWLLDAAEGWIRFKVEGK
jgi:hypothetical protein